MLFVLNNLKYRVILRPRCAYISWMMKLPCFMLNIFVPCIWFYNLRGWVRRIQNIYWLNLTRIRSIGLCLSRGTIVRYYVWYIGMRIVQMLRNWMMILIVIRVGHRYRHINNIFLSSGRLFLSLSPFWFLISHVIFFLSFIFQSLLEANNLKLHFLNLLLLCNTFPSPTLSLLAFTPTKRALLFLIRSSLSFNFIFLILDLNKIQLTSCLRNSIILLFLWIILAFYMCWLV